jgi:HSP20 family protein
MKAIVPAWRSNSIAHNWFNEFDQLFEDFFDQKVDRGMSLACDIEESEKFILFSFDLPGLTEDQIQIEVNDNILSIFGEREQEISSDTTRRLSGRRFGGFRQSFGLPKTVDQDKIEADYTNGVLKVLLPKREVSSAKKVEVKSKKGGFLSELLGGKREA